MVGGRERCLLLGRAGTRPGAPDFGDVPVVVEGYVAAGGEELVDLGATALNTRLHAGDREAGDVGRLDLGELAEVGEGQRLAVWLWQPLDQWFEAAGKLLAGLSFVGSSSGESERRTGFPAQLVTEVSTRDWWTALFEGVHF